MTTILNPQDMSRLTRSLFEYERGFVTENPLDNSVSDKIKTELVGRVVVLGVSLALHAEAVCRAVYLCFLALSQNNPHLMAKQKKACAIAYDVSVRSFFSIFYQKLLPQMIEISLHKQDIASVSVELPEPQREKGSPSGSTSELSKESEQKREEASPIGSKSEPSVFVEDELESESAPSSPIPSPISSRRSSSASSHSSVASSQPGTGEYDHISLDDLLDQSPLPPEAAPVFPLSDDQQVPEDVRSSPGEELTSDERARIRQLNASDAARKATFLKLQTPLSAAAVESNLKEEYTNAQLFLNHPAREVPFQVGPPIGNNPKWTFSKGFVDGRPVGICHYAEGASALSAHHFIQGYEIQVQEVKYPVSVFGVFDPQLGVRASDYLSKNLEKVLTQKILECDLTTFVAEQEGMYNAISRTFFQLNVDFISENKEKKLDPRLSEVVADQGSSVTVVLIAGGALWTAQLGDSRGVLENGGTPVQLTVDADPRNPKFAEKVSSLGGTVSEAGLVNGKLGVATAIGHHYLRGAVNYTPGITRIFLNDIKPNSHLIIGTEGIFKIVSTETVTGWLHGKDIDANNLAYNVVYSVYRENQKSALQSERTKSLSALVAKINVDADWENIPVEATKLSLYASM